MLSSEGDEMSAVLQITAGAGGTESCDWANMLCIECIQCGARKENSELRS